MNFECYGCGRKESDEGERDELRRYLRTFLRNHLAEAGIGSVSTVGA